MNDASDAIRLRLDGASTVDEATRTEVAESGGSETFVGRTFTYGAYPTAAAVYYWVAVQSVMGTESEGSAGVLADTGAVALALNLGTGKPPASSHVLVKRVNHRWTFRFDG